jgi:hypothetical protein
MPYIPNPVQGVATFYLELLICAVQQAYLDCGTGLGLVAKIPRTIKMRYFGPLEVKTLVRVWVLGRTDSTNCPPNVINTAQAFTIVGKA